MTQSTITQVTTETCLKAVGRPAFILMDKNIDNQTKKYSYTKEFLYQLTCLGICTFAAAKKLYKNEPVFQAFKNSGEFLNYHKLDETGKIAKLNEINQNLKSGDKFVKENINENFAKGLIEISSIAGSVTGLAIIAPIASHPLIHPILKVLGVDKKNDKPEQDQTIQPAQINK